MPVWLQGIAVFFFLGGSEMNRLCTEHFSELGNATYPVVSIYCATAVSSLQMNSLGRSINKLSAETQIAVGFDLKKKAR